MEEAGKAAADLGDGGGGRRGRGAAETLTSACCRGSAPAPRSQRRSPPGPGSAPGAARRGCRRRPGPPRPPAPAAALGAPRRRSTPQPGRPSPAGRRPASCPTVGAPGTRRCPGREPCAPSRSPGRGDALQCEPERGQGRPPACRVLLIPVERSARSEAAGPSPGGAELRRGAPAGWAAREARAGQARSAPCWTWRHEPRLDPVLDPSDLHPLQCPWLQLAESLSLCVTL